MATKAARGTKRTCQNSDCGSRFYDLNRDPITCPICGSAYVLAVTAAAPTAAAVAVDKVRKAAKAPEFESADGEKAEAAEPSAEEALADIEAGDEPVAVEDDETFLEEEEDSGSDVSGIVSGPEGEEEA